jgi:hypothetical protein
MKVKPIREVLSASLFVAGLCFHGHGQAAGAGIAGDYHVHGENPDGRPYEGALRIEQKGEVYALTWETGGTTNGIGILSGNTLIASYGGPTCGVVAYRKRSGTLDGIWAMSNSTQLGTETATPVQGDAATLSGDYIVTGRNTDKTPYKGALFVKESAGGKVSLMWRTGPDARGFGFQTGDTVAVAFGPATCGLVEYSLAPDGALNGRWSFLQGGFGSEKAQRTGG